MRNTYCSYPFSEIYSDNSSKYRLCCFADINKSIEKYDAVNTLPFDYFMSDEMEQIRQDMMEGKRIQGCEYCYKLEDAGKSSPRIEKYKDKFKQKAEVKEVDLKLRIGGSQCNLGCYMCIPYNSSFRRQELKEAGIKVSWEKSPKNVSNKRFNEIIDNIIENIDKVNNIYFIGGEPVIIPRMWEIMDRIPNEAAKNISISFQTNLTKLNFNNHSVFDIKNKFKDLKMFVSCDHFGEKLKWIRYPIDVEEFERNLFDAKDLISNIDCTTSLLNVNDLPEIKEYYKNKFDLNTDFRNVVVTPSILSCKNIKNKEELLHKYKSEEFKMVRNELSKEYNKKELEQGINYCLSLSKHRKIDFWKVFEDVAKKIL